MLLILSWTALLVGILLAFIAVFLCLMAIVAAVSETVKKQKELKIRKLGCKTGRCRRK